MLARFIAAVFLGSSAATLQTCGCDYFRDAVRAEVTVMMKFTWITLCCIPAEVTAARCLFAIACDVRVSLSRIFSGLR